MTLAYVSEKTQEGARWLGAHKRLHERRKPSDMPRAFLEFELGEIFLADKEAHTGRKFGAKPKHLPTLAKLMQMGAPAVQERGSLPIREHRESAAYVQDEAQKCVALWRAVIEQQAFDTLKMWGASKEDHKQSKMFFVSNAERWREAREGVCAMALIEPEELTNAFNQGRLKQLADNAIGRERYVTRLINAQSSTDQPDLFYSMGIR